jgi:hypothetical protein
MMPRGTKLLAIVVVAALAAAPAVAAGADQTPPQIHTVAGGGTCKGALTAGGPCDGILATPPQFTTASPGAPPVPIGPASLPAAILNGPATPIAGARSVAALTNGGFLYIDAGTDLVREVSADGIVTTVAGDGTAADAPDGSLAVNSGLDEPVSVATLPNGGFLITEYGGSRVRLVSPGTPATATITTIAGTGSPGFNGLIGPAASMRLNYPTDAEPTASGGVLIADTFNNRIRLLSAAAPGATMSTIAGGGACDDVASVCDGLAANTVQLDHPDSVSPLQDGSGGYLIVEYDASAIRSVSEMSASGTFTTVAGLPGTAGYAGDGGPATAALLNHPEQVVSTPGGGFLIADTGNQVIRRVSAGAISTIAGDAVPSFAGDDDAATADSLHTPVAVSPMSDGNILIADQDNDRIREITLVPEVTLNLSPPAPNGSAGWYTAPVTAAVSTTEGATVNCQLDPPIVPPAFGAIQPGCAFLGSGATVGNGMHTLYAAAENSFLDQSLPVSVTVKVDTGAPKITCPTPPSFPFGTVKAQVAATLADSVSGPAAEILTAPADTSRIGLHTVLLKGSNGAGTATSDRCSYTVTPLVLAPTPVVSWSFASRRLYTTVARLDVGHVPAPAAVSVACIGRGCPFTLRLVARASCSGQTCQSGRPRSRMVVLSSLFANVRLAPGAMVGLIVTEPHTTGRIVEFTFRSRQSPSSRTTCLVAGIKLTSRVILLRTATKSAAGSKSAAGTKPGTKSSGTAAC